MRAAGPTLEMVPLHCWQAGAGPGWELHVWAGSFEHGSLHRLLELLTAWLLPPPTTSDPGEKEPHRRDPCCDLDSGVISITLCHILFVRRERRIIVSLFGERTGLPTWFNGGKKKKKMPANAGDPGSISESGRSPGEANGNPLQCSCLENPMDREAWWAIVHGVAKSQT